MKDALGNLRANFMRIAFYYRLADASRRIAWKRVAHELIHGTPMPDADWQAMVRQVVAAEDDALGASR